MQIKFIIYFIPSISNSGGTERILSTKLNYLANTGLYNITVFTEETKEKAYFKFSDKINFVYYQSFDVLGTNKIYYYIRYAYFVFNYIKKICNLLKSMKFDIAISIGSFELFVLPFLTDGSKKVLELHFPRNIRKLSTKLFNRSLFFSILQRFRTFVEEIVIKKYDAFVVLTQKDKDMWGSTYANIFVINNSLDEYPCSTLSLDSKNIIWVGRYSLEKGYDRMLRIWKSISVENKGWTLSFFGDGPDKAIMYKIALNLDIIDSIKINSPIPNIYTEYNNSSIYVCTSYYEGFGLSILEAMSCGLPVIAFDCESGPSELICDSKYGFLIENGDEKRFADTLVYLINNYHIRKEISLNSIERSMQFNKEKIMKDWINLFNTIIA